MEIRLDNQSPTNNSDPELKIISQKTDLSLVNATNLNNEIGNWVFIVPMYIFLYTMLAGWLLFDGLINSFSSIFWVWSIEATESFPALVVYLGFTILGAILGSALLGIISFHRYKAIEKTFDLDHLWGFFFSPLLAAIVGILMFAIIQSGLIVLSGDLSTAANNESATLGYLAIGGVTGYNWDVFIKKLQDLSKDILNTTS
jgi:hypothetical protein